jgi:hypothetical protein
MQRLPTLEAHWRALGDVSNLFDPQECWNDPKAVDYAFV